MAEELGINNIISPIDNKIELYEPLAGCHAYTNYFTKLAVYGSNAEVLAAILVDFPVWRREYIQIDLVCFWINLLHHYLKSLLKNPII
jgi:hypothetical protein